MFSSKSSSGVPVPSFIGFVFSLIGWGLVETGLIAQRVGLPVHLVATLIAAYLAFSSIKSLQAVRDTLGRGNQTICLQGNKLDGSRILWALVLASAGAAMGALIKANSVFLFGIGAVGLVCLPWSRIPLCRDHLIVASFAMCTGVALPMLITYRHLDAIYLLFAAWTFWMLALFAVLLRITQVWQRERSMRSAARAGAR